MVDLAAHILDTKTSKFDPRKFKDKYEIALKALVKRKAAGKTIEVPKEKEEESNVIDLMDALKQSLGHKKATTSPAKGRKRGTIHRGRKRRAPEERSLSYRGDGDPIGRCHPDRRGVQYEPKWDGFPLPADARC